MSPERNLNDLFQIEVPDTDAFEEEDTPTRDTDLLNGLRVASPCNASWDEMEGDDLVRFCRHCQLHVYNLSGMSQREAADFIRQTEGQLCIRFYRRRDGTLLTDNCSRGLRRDRLAIGMLSALIGLGLWIFGALYLEVKEQARIAWCCESLRKASAAFLAFEKRHGGHFPQRLEELDLATVGTDAFCCPSAPELGSQAYVYRPPRKDAPDETPILICWRHPYVLVLNKGGRVHLASHWPAGFDPRSHGAILMK